VIILLEDTKSQFKLLSSSLEDIEQDILKMKNIIEQRKTEHIIFEDNILYWQKKRESARISLDCANKACDTNKRIVQELNNELERINNELTKLRKASQTSIIELSNSQVYCTVVISVNTYIISINLYYNNLGKKYFGFFIIFYNKFL